MAKREIYGRLAVQLRTHERCSIAEEICPGAMGLYLFLVLQARGEETHGETRRSIAMSSWSGKGSYRAKQAAALIDAGLVEEKDGRLVVVKYLDHNDGPEAIAAAKESANLRQDRKRHPEKYDHVTRDTVVTAASNPSSSSCSPCSSDLGSRSEDPDPASATPPAPPSRPHNDSPDVAAPPVSLVPRQPFEPGTAGSEAGRVGFETAVSRATGKPFALARAPFHDRDLCAALNTHAPSELVSKAEVIATWLPSTIAAWVIARGDSPTPLLPGKLLDWLNAGRPEVSKVRSRGRGGGPKGDRQGLDGWTPPTGTDTDFFAGGEK